MKAKKQYQAKRFTMLVRHPVTGTTVEVDQTQGCDYCLCTPAFPTGRSYGPHDPETSCDECTGKFDGVSALEGWPKQWQHHTDHVLWPSPTKP